MKELLKNKISTNSLEDKNLINKFLIPDPKIQLGKKIKSYATSIIDISDGLLSELHHLSENSEVGANIYIKDIPFSPAANNYLEANLYNYIDLITGGDDYELLYTVDPKNKDLIDEDSEDQQNENVFYLTDNLKNILNHNKWLLEFIFWELSFYKCVGYDIEFKDYVSEEIGSNGNKKYFVKSTKKNVF